VQPANVAADEIHGLVRMDRAIIHYEAPAGNG
jgi:hypothetical protein